MAEGKINPQPCPSVTCSSRDGLGGEGMKFTECHDAVSAAGRDSWPCAERSVPPWWFGAIQQIAVGCGELRWAALGWVASLITTPLDVKSDDLHRAGMDPSEEICAVLGTDVWLFFFAFNTEVLDPLKSDFWLYCCPFAICCHFEDPQSVNVISGQFRERDKMALNRETWCRR